LWANTSLPSAIIKVLLRDAFGNALSSPTPEAVPTIQIQTIPATTSIDKGECTYVGCAPPYTGQCLDLKGVYECIIEPQFAGADRYLSVMVGGVDVSQLEVLPPLNNTRVVVGPFPINIIPGDLWPPRSEVMDLPLYYNAAVYVPVLLQFRDKFGNNLLESPYLKNGINARMGGEQLQYVDNTNGTLKL
jgi:hypothetical protein